MPLEVRKKEGESVGSFLYRFNKKMQQSGVVKEVKKRQFRKRVGNKRTRRLAALYREDKRGEIAKARKLGMQEKSRGRGR
jgi:ribosomal protein S21